MTNARNESPNYCTSIKKYYKIVNSLEILDYCLVGLACCVTVPRLYILGRLPVTRGLQYFTQMAIHAKQGCRIRLEGNGRKKATGLQWTFFFNSFGYSFVYIYIYVNIKSPDERVITKQACKNESIFSLFFPYLKNIYMHIYIYIYVCVCVCVCVCMYIYVFKDTVNCTVSDLVPKDIDISFKP